MDYYRPNSGKTDVLQNQSFKHTWMNQNMSKDKARFIETPKTARNEMSNSTRSGSSKQWLESEKEVLKDYAIAIKGERPEKLKYEEDVRNLILECYKQNPRKNEHQQPEYRSPGTVKSRIKDYIKAMFPGKIRTPVKRGGGGGNNAAARHNELAKKMDSIYGSVDEMRKLIIQLMNSQNLIINKLENRKV